ncbi:hypothetical protein QR98_0008740 [Sarcoptes scabiei]|uniref:Uncharacterized protein n=1 Tax=Sarcoptes scabiei TaxID=52283 RepID=A0A131ZWG8_SARSC|nr:hypothetical protein QR98_0008740 [Sarcoptes scabiei]
MPSDLQSIKPSSSQSAPFPSPISPPAQMMMRKNPLSISVEKEPNRINADPSMLIYWKRYNDLREAGFDDTTASKYSPLYSSVNQVIDAILSQSLNENLYDGQSSLYPIDAVNQHHLPKFDKQKVFDRIQNVTRERCLFEDSPPNGLSIQNRSNKLINVDEGMDDGNNIVMTILDGGLFNDSNNDTVLANDSLTREVNQSNSSSPSSSSSSTSPATSALLSSGISSTSSSSSFFIDNAISSTSPSSFSSFSSSISITPPNSSGNFDGITMMELNGTASNTSISKMDKKIEQNCVVENACDDSLIGSFPIESEQQHDPKEENNCQKKVIHNRIGYGPFKIDNETNDLNNEETFNKFSQNPIPNLIGTNYLKSNQNDHHHFRNHSLERNSIDDRRSGNELSSRSSSGTLLKRKEYHVDIDNILDDAQKNICESIITKSKNNQNDINGNLNNREPQTILAADTLSRMTFDPFLETADTSVALVDAEDDNLNQQQQLNWIASRATPITAIFNRNGNDYCVGGGRDEHQQHHDDDVGGSRGGGEERGHFDVHTNFDGIRATES